MNKKSLENLIRKALKEEQATQQLDEAHLYCDCKRESDGTRYGKYCYNVKSCAECCTDGKPGKTAQTPSIKAKPSVREQAKPDFLDLDGDGDKEESMKKAAKDKKKSEKKESTLESLVRQALEEVKLEEQRRAQKSKGPKGKGRTKSDTYLPPVAGGGVFQLDKGDSIVAAPDLGGDDNDDDQNESALKKSANNMAMYGKKSKLKEAEMTAGADNTKFKIKVDVSNKQSETKLGVRIQLTPKEGMLEPDVKDKLEATVMKKLNTSLGQYDIQVSKDTDVPNPEVIGFFIPLSQIKNMIISAVKGGSGQTAGATPAAPAAPPKPATPPPPKPATPPKPANQNNKAVNEVIDEAMLLKEMRVRDLKEISKVVMKEDFYSFINAGNNVLRSLEERGIDRGKKYLEYLVKHNIM